MYEQKIIAHNLKATKEQIIDDLNGVMTPLQRRMMKELLSHLDELNTHIKNLDDEIERTKDACLLDMERVGICFQNKLTDSAVILYCKADFDFQGKGQQYMQNYEKLRDAMSLCETYREGTQEDV